MTYLVTGTKVGNGSITIPEHLIFDTEDEGKAQAEKFLQKGYQEVAVWKQVAAPTLIQTVSWGNENA